MLSRLKILFLFIFILFSIRVVSQSGYQYGISQKILATDFINSTNRIKTLTALPRGIELNLTKYISSKAFIQIPMRVGFSRASNLDTFTTGKAFYGFDCQYGRFIKGYKLIPYIATGFGIQNLNRQWQLNVPAVVGLEIPIDSAFFLSFHASYRYAPKESYSAFQYGLGVCFKIGSRNKIQKESLNSPLYVESTVLKDSQNIQNYPATEVFVLPNIEMRFISYRKDSVRLAKQIENITHKDTDKTLNTENYLGHTQNIKFKTNSAELTPESIDILEEIAQKLNSKPAVSITIEGHTDNTGSNAYNLRLSFLRAKTCYDYLVKFGVKPSRMTQKGWGETKPKMSNDTAYGREANRRVEIY